MAHGRTDGSDGLSGSSGWKVPQQPSLSELRRQNARDFIYTYVLIHYIVIVHGALNSERDTLMISKRTCSGNRRGRRRIYEFKDCAADDIFHDDDNMKIQMLLLLMRSIRSQLD